ncbi:MAG: aminoacyl-histidine dipeptidase [Lachnospiraceae bacterium]|nr:aminoacyl-histidine dipeptidase [Lachnospiraceae bacterium]
MTDLHELLEIPVFHYFGELSKIPHGSRNTKEISDYIVSFAKAHDLKYIQDDANNVIIYKPATPGYESAPTVIIQGHCDMVCEKKPGSDHDFFKDPLDLAIEGDHLYAKDTTLGGDDGIAVAAAMAILADDALQHPALEVVVTTDEEIGLLGAAVLDTSVLKGKIMLNMDSEDEGHFVTGCAGGMTAVSTVPVKYHMAEGQAFELLLTGLNGGHSGVEIDKKRANANAVMGRILYTIGQSLPYSIVQMAGGLKDNAIPRECRCVIVTESGQEQVLRDLLENLNQDLLKEYQGSDDGIRIVVTDQGCKEYSALDPSSRERLVFYLMNVPTGIQKMSAQIENLVETSTNLGIFNLLEDSFVASSSVRSSVTSGKNALADKIHYLTEFLGGEFTVQGAYPAWEYNAVSPLRDKMVALYEEMEGKKPVVEVIHAGLECGLFYDAIQGLDCVSYGPDMLNIHTTEEKLSISSVKRIYDYTVKLLELLK